MLFLQLFLAVPAVRGAYQTVTNDVWLLDNNGNPVMAQGGGISRFGGTYYWYGVQYAEMTPYFQSGTVNTASSTFVAINCYSSTDLVHWTFQNHSITTSTAGFNHAGWVGRLGQVVYNSADNQYVMWFEGLNGQACCTCSSPTGNFALDHVQPAITNVYSGPGAGDCTIFCDVDHGSKPYFICSDPHGRQHAYVCPLAANYLAIGNAVAINDTGNIPAWPQGQEASNMFERNGIYYYTMSNLAGWSYSTAYEVNTPSIFSPTAYTADAAYLGTTADFTHYSQVSFGFQMAGTVTTNYLMVGDRWAQFINTYASAGHGLGFSIICPITFTNGTPYFQSLNEFQIDAVTGKWRLAVTADTPTNFSAISGAAQVVLNWSASDGAVNYNVKRAAASGGPYAIIASPTTNTYTDTGLQNGTTYFYEVSATNSFGDSTNTVPLSAVPSIGPVISSASASPNPVYPGQAVVISATVAAQTNAIGAVTVNASAIGGSASQPLLPDGEGDFTNTVTVGAATPIAVQTLTVNASDTLGNISSPVSFPLTIASFTITWNGGGADNNWSDAMNWTGGAPGTGDTLVFAGLNRPAPSMDNSYNIFAVTFDNSAGAFTLGGNGGTLTLTGGLTNNSPNAQSVNLPVALGAPVTFNAASAGLVLGQAINNGGNLLTITDGGQNTTVSGAISGSGGLVKNGPGTNMLTGLDTFGGALAISNGTVLVAGAGQLGGGKYTGNITDNGSLTFNGTAGEALIGNISGSGALNQSGASTLILSGQNTFSGVTTVTAGGLQIASAAALPGSTLVYIGGNVTFNGGITTPALGGLAGTQNLSLLNTASAPVALNVGSNNATTIFSGGLSGAGGSLVKSGSGTLTLKGVSSYTGATTVNGGTLELSAGGVIQGGALGGGGFLVDGGSLSSTGNTGLSAVNNALAESAGAVSLGAITEPNADGLLIKITGGSFSAASLTLQRTAQFLTAPTATAPIAGATTSGLYVNGVTAAVNLGALTIGTGNSSDSVRLDAGALVVTNEVLVGHTSNSRWEILQVNGGSFTSLDTVNGIVLAQNNGGASNNAELYLSGGTTTVGKIAFGTATDTTGGSGFLIVTNAALYLGGGGLVRPTTAVYTCVISLLGGTVGATADWSSSLAMQLNGASFTFQSVDALGVAHNISLGGVLSGSGALVKTGAGRLILNATNTYAGATTIDAGTLAVNGTLAGGALTVASGGTLSGTGVVNGPVTVQSGGIFSPGGSIGTLTISNALTLQAGCTNLFELSASPATNDVARISGALTLAGTLVVTNPGGVAPAAGATFRLLNAASYAGAFTRVVLPPLPVGLGWNTNLLNTAGTLSVVMTSRPAIGSITVSANGLVLAGSGGVGGANFYLLGATNLALPMTNWTRLLTNQFDDGGNFNLTNALDPAAPRGFYLIQAP